MDADALMRVALVLFGLAAAGSVLIAIVRLSGHARAPHWLATGYGVLSGFGLALIGLVALTSGISAMAQVAMVPFLLAAASDSVLTRLLHRNRLPMSVAVLRAFLAGFAFVLLLVSIYGQMYLAKLPIPTTFNSN